MRKYIIGMIFGFLLSLGVGVHAEIMTMIGKTIDNEYDLTINGQKMEYQAVSIDGTTYAPVRMLGEATGHIVRFNAETGVTLVKKIVTPRTTVMKSIEVLNAAIERNENAIQKQQEVIKMLKMQQETPSVITNIQAAERSIENHKQDINGCQEQIALQNKVLTEIDAQEAELAK